MLNGVADALEQGFSTDGSRPGNVSWKGACHITCTQGHYSLYLIGPVRRRKNMGLCCLEDFQRVVEDYQMGLLFIHHDPKIAGCGKKQVEE